jgi:branched-chain amino acid transport system permease protein
VAPEGLFWFARDCLVTWRQARRLPKPGASGGTISSGGDVRMLHPVASRNPRLLVVTGLSKSFRGLRAVNDVSLEVPEGTVYGVIGQNGAGKTTVFNLLSGFIAPDTGTVSYDGKDVTGRSPTEISRLGIGRTFQVPRPFLRLSVLENVVVGAISTESDDARARLRAVSVIATVELMRSLDTLASELNAVELRLLELARALAGAPRLVLLDEIFAGLAREEVALLLKVVKRLPLLGVTVMIIEHTMHAMLEICDSLVVLDHGVVIASGPPLKVIANPAVVEAYLGRKWVSEHATA